MNENLIEIQNILSSNDNYYQTIQSTNSNSNTITNIKVFMSMTIEEYNELQKNKNILIRENMELKKENEALTEEITEEINNLQKQIFELTNKIKNLQKENKKLIKRISRLSYN